MRDGRLDIENYLRTSKGKKPFKNLEELEKEQTAQLDKNQKPDVTDDALLVETGAILSDWINVKSRMLASQKG